MNNNDISDFKSLEQYMVDCEILLKALQPFDEDFIHTLFHRFLSLYMRKDYDEFYGLMDEVKKELNNRIESSRSKAISIIKKPLP